MFQALSFLNPKKAQIKQVVSLHSYLFLFSIKPHFLSTGSVSDHSLPSTSSTHKTTKTHIDSSSVNCIGIAQSVLSKLSLFADKTEAQRGNLFNDPSFKGPLLDISNVIPDVTRRFMRVERLKPENVLELLLGFQFECEKVVVKGEKVESLWRIFRWAGDQDNDFRHLPKSCEVMASILIQYQMFTDVQWLLLAMERGGIPWDDGSIFCRLIEGYVAARDLERAVLVYDQMREQGLIPSLSCYRSLIDLLVQMNRTQLALRISLDMMEKGFNWNYGEISSLENVGRLLCRDGRIKEARNLIKKLVALGFQCSSFILNEIASGYCEKKDFEDSLSFFGEMNFAPNVLVANKIISSICSNVGIERANGFRLEIESFGFKPDEITFAILIGWSCRKGNLRSAFIYLSEMLSRDLKPDMWSYNALIGAVFKEGLWNHARDILDEMVDSGTKPNLTTFRILLAGYCKARKFDEAKMMVCEMVNHGLIESSALEDLLSKSFMFVGLSPLSVRLRRDNDVKFLRTEFFDHLGNGLYLDADPDDYDNRLAEILQDSLVPDFNLLVGKECEHENFKDAFKLVDEMFRWGQELSLSVFSSLVKGLCVSRSRFKAYSSLVEKMPNLSNRLDQEVLNVLVQAHCKYGLAYKGKRIYDEMLQRNLTIDNRTYTSLILGLSKKGSLGDLNDCWDVARIQKWMPDLEKCEPIFECLSHHGMLKEALELLECMLVSCPHSRSKLCHLFLERFSVTGFTWAASLLVEELLERGFVLDDISYSHLIGRLCKEKNFDIAFTILDNMLATDLVPCLDVSLILIPQLCKANRLEKAIALRETVSKEQPIFSIALNGALIEGYCRMGNVDKAAYLLQVMLSEGKLPDGEVYNMLFQGYCKAKNLRKARDLLAILIRKCSSFPISSYRLWVRFMCAEGRFSCALSLMDLMIREGKCNGLVLYNILLFYLLSVGNSSLVNKVLDEMKAKGLPLDEVTYNFLVCGFSKCRIASTSLLYLSTMISMGFRPSYHSLRTAMSLLHDAGELDKILELSKEMEEKGWVHGSVVQNVIVECLLSHEKFKEAEYFLDRMVGKGLVPDTINYDNLIKQFCNYERPNKAVDLLNVMLKKGSVPTSASYDSVIRGLCKQDRLIQAMDFHAEMLERDLKPSIKTWDILVKKFCEHGQTAEAEKLLNLMVQVGETPTRLMYSIVINRYRFENNLTKASKLMQMMQQSGYEPDFDTQWSLISNLSNSSDRGNNNSGGPGFLSRLLSGSGFSWKEDLRSKRG